MRSVIVAALAFALSACGQGSEGGELAAGNSEISSAQVDAALGPADQSSVEDAISGEDAQNDVVTGNDTVPSTNSDGAEDEDEQ